MNPLIVGFKTCAHQAGAVCNFGTGKLVREFGLQDFLENAIQEGDDTPAIAIKALRFFCDEYNPTADVFKFGVLTVGAFLNRHHAARMQQVPQQALRDLVDLLKSSPSDDQLRGWIDSHF
jgi:hypothetical protein